MSSQLREARDAAAEKEAELVEARDGLQRELDQSLAENASSQSRLGERERGPETGLKNAYVYT